MRKVRFLRHTVWRSICCIVASVAFAAAANAQTPEEHASHHPAGGADSPAVTESAMPAMGGPSAAGAMSEMDPTMKQMGTPPPKQFYPSLMELPELTPEKRQELEQLARARLASGTALMSSGLDKLSQSAMPEDLATMQDAVAQIRTGVHEFEGGVAALRTISSDQPPSEVALGWFKRNTNLPVTQDIQNPHGIFGLSGFHYFSMLLLIVVATALLWMNFKKMQRAKVLLTRLSGEGQSIPLPEKPVASPQLSREPVSVIAASSKPNSWTGLLRVSRIFDETPNVRTLRLTDLSGGDLPFRHLPGQFITFTVKPIEQPIKRSYTIASSPTRREYCEVTIKREDKGTVSNFLHHVHEGDTLQVTGPSGNFTFIGEGANSIVLIAGGVGITPMMSVLRFLTDRSWTGDIFFVYGCRGEQDVIYREELEYLQRRHRNLHLTIAASDVVSKEWPYKIGHISKDVLTEAIPHIHTLRIHLCGPPAMMTAMQTLLAELAVPAEQIKSEVFIGRERPLVATVDSAPASDQVQHPEVQTETAAPAGVAVATFARSKRTALLKPTKTVLEAAEEVGVNIEYSCRVGVCGICKVKLLSGTVTMEVQDALDAQDKQDNIILACQAKSTGDVSVDA
ncbi:MAG: 2Fe-2S iron-sulfur cluster-binding protein [Steroidobacteraceae bacterium]